MSIMKKTRTTEHVIRNVLPGSIAQELEIEPGDVLLSVGGEKVEDVFDYHYLTNEEYLEVVIRKPSGEEWELEIEKEFEEDLGIEFENPLLDEYRSCSNACIFCFIDQMPKGMRETLYFKDDDSRLSFLQGNYVTLTNMSDHDISRIIRYRLEPINISFQTMNPELRCTMLRNRFAGDVFPKIRRLYEAGITMNGQIVLCKGVNDGEELERSLRELEQYVPHLQSVSVVPVGLTKFREGLYPLEPFTASDAKHVLDQIGRWQDHYMRRYGIHLVHASDEWYFLAGRPIPEASCYDGYLQLENGVGMIRLLIEEVEEYLSSAAGSRRQNTEEAESSHSGENMPESCISHTVTIATGQLAADTIRMLCARVCEVYPQIRCNVIPIRNDFFGEQITVAGLITGQDLKKQLAGKDLGNALLLPCNMLRSGENVFLDDVTVEELSDHLQVPVRIVDSDGASFVKAIRLL